MMMTMPPPTPSSSKNGKALLVDLIERGRKTSPGTLIVSSIRLARLLGGVWLVAWGLLRITRVMAQAAVGLGGLSVIGGLSLIGVRSAHKA